MISFGQKTRFEHRAFKNDGLAISLTSTELFQTQIQNDQKLLPSLKFLRRSVDGKHLMRFQSETSVFTLLRLGVDGD